jgi:hypothetical protein
MSGASTPLVDFQSLVDTAADTFQTAYAMAVTWDGRKALVDPALEHQEQVSAELATGKITYEFLVGSVSKVLQNGYGIAKDEGLNAIDKYVVTKSMKKYCPYIMWC